MNKKQIVVALFVVSCITINSVLIVARPNKGLVAWAKNEYEELESRAKKEYREFRDALFCMRKSGFRACTPAQQKRIAAAGVAVLAAAVVLTRGRFAITRGLHKGLSIEELPAVYQLQVARQVGNTCGYHSAYNVKHITEMLEKKLMTGILERPIVYPFTSSTEDAYDKGQKGEWREAVETTRKDLFPDLESVEFKTDMLSADEIQLLMQKFYPSFEYWIFNSQGGFSSDNIKDSEGLRKSIWEFKRSQKRILPIIVSLETAIGSHWAVDVLYKNKGGDIKHILADSYGEDIANNTAMQSIIEMVP